VNPEHDVVDLLGIARQRRVKVSRFNSEFFTASWLSATTLLMFCSVARMDSVTSCSAFGSAVSVGTPSSSRGTAGAATSPPFSDIAATPVSPWKFQAYQRVLADRRVVLDHCQRDNPPRIVQLYGDHLSDPDAVKLTLPPLRKPAAGPSKMTRSGLRALVRGDFETTAQSRTPPRSPPA